MNIDQPCLGIALGGGAALGYAHLGILEVLDVEGICPDLVVGTSMGALVGAAYVSWPNIGATQRRFRVGLEDPFIMGLNLDYLKSKTEASFWELLFGKIRRGLMVTQSMIRDSIVDAEAFSRILRNLLPDSDIENLPRTFACISANLNAKQHRHLWTQGSLLQAAAASCAIPGIFPAQEINGDVHVDGGSVENIPVPAAKELGATFIIAINVDEEDTGHQPAVAAEYFVAASELSRRSLTDLQIRDAQVLLAPKLSQFHWADFQKIDEIIEQGRVAADAQIDEIRYLWQDHRKGFRKGVWAWMRTEK
ncbi:uncharacterized NTE family protein YlbK-like [Ylistrum balloti]|uniref:uncharacterized NTE family protein YlbK-like n=1 Tax=Ylistrum balloti TaxID=509963 RepID=UPI00290584AA|nr:uncharacterized NTE family protein YlbK-like [Ylistrum balloti]